MKKVLITGGATGIGKAAAIKFAQVGYDVTITYHKTCPDYEVNAVLCDVTKESDVLSLFDTIGNIDVLVNNAGVSLIDLIQDTTIEKYANVMNTNCNGTFLCCREAVKQMVRKKQGAIINIASIWGEVGASCEVAYSASKGAVIALTKALAKEVALSGITVNCVSPGIIDTRMNAAFDLQELCSEVPIGRVGTPNEVADAILFLAENKYITGQILGVDGGII